MAVRLTDQELGERIHAGRKQAFYVPLKPEANAERNRCHENAEAYVSRCVDCGVVRGWLLEDFADFSYFNAHSVVRDAQGVLFDPTPMNQHCLFLPHDGDDADFALQRENRPRVQFPVFEFDLDFLGASIEEDEKLPE